MNRKALAEQILDNKLFEKIVEDMSSRFYEDWKSSSDSSERESTFKKVEALTGLVNEIKENLMRIKDE